MTHISIGGVQLDEIRMELNKISNELHQINENTRLHCGDITDLKFANEIIDEQRKAIKILKEENEELKERVKQLQIDNIVIKKRYDTLIHEQLQNKPPIWFTQSAKLTDKQANEIAEAINQSLKERRIKK